MSDMSNYAIKHEYLRDVLEEFCSTVYKINLLTYVSTDEVEARFKKNFKQNDENNWLIPSDEQFRTFLDEIHETALNRLTTEMMEKGLIEYYIEDGIEKYRLKENNVH